MKRVLRSIADQGCWISDDRIYAFVSSDHGIEEIGYHGRQPVSRNSRLLVHPGGVVRFFVRTPDGLECPLLLNEIDWQPGGITALCDLSGVAVTLRITVLGRTLVADLKASHPSSSSILVRVSKASLFTEVQGERTWGPVQTLADGLLLHCRDRIMLQSWLARTGPYAGDFLIPEPVRRTIFAGNKRSGRATPEDLRPSYRNIDVPLYDASVWVRMGGEALAPVTEDDGWTFAVPAGQTTLRFSVRFGESPESVEGREGDPPAVRQAPKIGTEPQLHLEGCNAWEEFFRSVPGLVDSCVVRDLGVPRACPGRYYWIWAWDMLVTVAEALRWGETGLARRTVRFVEGHRDIQGVIPARWTRSLFPLDTPSPGGIEFLHAVLAYEVWVETGDPPVLEGIYPGLSQALQTSSAELRDSGMFCGAGFYPDLLAPFGRSDDRAATMETGAWYVLSRIVENMAHAAGDSAMADLASTCADSILSRFQKNFWDVERGFFADGVDPATGTKSQKHPLFGLLFLHSSLGLSLVRELIPAAATFVADEFMRPQGVRVVPELECGDGADVVLHAWYPHWDLYALKVLRRAGRAREIVRWLHRSEEVLQNLGYCPEYIEVFRFDENSAWRHHGSASNLNCVTGWYRAIREAVAGIEFDPGGMTHIPLALQVGRVVIERLQWRGGTWRVEVDDGGPAVEEMVVDGLPVEGCLKVPAPLVTPGAHWVVVRYGEGNRGVLLKELVNAGVLRCSRKGRGLDVAFSGLGYVEGVFASDTPCTVRMDGEPVMSVWREERSEGYFRVPGYGEHVLEIVPR